jgi:hypothetical protein
MSQAELLDAVPLPLRKHVDPSTPLAARKLAAQGLLPTPAREMVLMVCALSVDPDAEIANLARATLAQLPDAILTPVLAGELPGAALSVLAAALTGRDSCLEKILLNRATPDSVFVALAPTAPLKVAEFIAGNQQRCGRCLDIVAGLRLNPNLPRSSLAHLGEFLARAGLISADSVEDSADVELPPQTHALLQEDVSDGADMTPDLDAEDTAARVPIQRLIGGLSTAQKVALAIKGNKDARAILVRDTNRTVATAAIRNPRITEQEIAALRGEEAVHVGDMLDYLEIHHQVEAGAGRGQILGRHRPASQPKQRVDLGYGTIDAPASPHLTPVQDDLFKDRRHRHGITCQLFLSSQKLLMRPPIFKVQACGPRTHDENGADPGGSTPR